MLNEKVLSTLLLRPTDYSVRRALKGQFSIDPDGFVVPKSGSRFDKWIKTTLVLLTVPGHDQRQDDLIRTNNYNPSDYKVLTVVNKLLSVASITMFATSNTWSKPVFNFNYATKDVLAPGMYNDFIADVNANSKQKFGKTVTPTFQHPVLSELPAVFMKDGQLHRISTSSHFELWAVVLMGVTAELEGNYAPTMTCPEIMEAIDDAMQSESSTN